MKNSKYALKDISIIIPTYNRSEDLKKTLLSFKSQIKELNEVLIIDQSTNDSVQDAVKSLSNKKIKYIKTLVPSLTRARNLGIRKASKKSTIIGFLDDDVSLDKDYFKNVISVFNENDKVNGVSGWFIPKIHINTKENIIRRIFFLEHLEKNRARVLSAYGATYPYFLNKQIESEWLSGFNMFFKKKIVNEFKFDENMKKYALAEDFDFSYRVNKKYPHSLIITPKAKIIHRVSNIERMPTEKIAYMNQIHHFYLNYKNFDSNFKEKLIFIWAVLGISALRTSLFLITRSKSHGLKLKFFFKSLIYCLKNLKRIKRGNLND